MVMSVVLLDDYLKALQNNLEKGSERTHYPALKALFDRPEHNIEVVIEEKGNKAGIPDFTVKQRLLVVGYVEAKDVGADLDQSEKTEQLQRYLESFTNFILTNYLEFRWYVNGQRRLKEIIADRSGDKLQLKTDHKVSALLDQFIHYSGEIINNPEDLAQQMARLTKAIRLATATALEQEDPTGELHQLQQGFREVLLPDLNDTNFSDMYAQTISYELFAARVGHAQQSENESFTRRTASTYIPATNPFLKRLFNTIVETDVISQIDWAIDDLVQLLSQSNMGSILENFGRRTRQEDPIVHFYETFLAAYDAALRKSRGVYYTPEPVVSFIVRSIDSILKTRFDFPLGLADNAPDPETQKSRLQILDPATGTGTFLYEVVKQIYRNLEAVGLENQWNNYVRDNLLDRMFGFELLMAPYAIAHLKLGLELQDLGYQFQGKQRLKIYLTNTLDEALKKSEVLFGQFVAQEANEASSIKRDLPVMVVLGNPPYSYASSNTGDWIQGLVRDYYKVNSQDLGEKNPKGLQDDYVKFIRFGQWRIDRTGAGILAFITNHGYLDNPTFRGMRQSLMNSFTDIYILNLHGNAKKKEVSPDGSRDQNIFDIQQGVSIGIFIKEPGKEPGKQEPAKVHHAELWGDRRTKYQHLNESSVDQISWQVSWQVFTPHSPAYLFFPQNIDLLGEYNLGWKITDIMPLYSVGVKTHRDRFLVGFDFLEIKNRIQDFRNLNISDQEILFRYKLNSIDTWNLRAKRNHVVADAEWIQKINKCLYRPFDFRFYYYDPDLVERPRIQVMQHMLSENIGFITTRQTKEAWDIKVSNLLIDNKSLAAYDTNSLFPLYKYPESRNSQSTLFLEKTPNFSSGFMAAIQEKLGYLPTPETIFNYIYAVFHSPTYRQRYAELLKVDFPRVPLTRNDRLFQDLAAKGQELVDLHLMTSKKLNQFITTMEGDGNNEVTEVTYRPSEQRIYINKTCYFQGITPDLWTFQIGGYQVLDKWLKDRKKAKRTLSFDEVLHYQKVVVALKETMQVMQDIDQRIPAFPLE